MKRNAFIIFTAGMICMGFTLQTTETGKKTKEEIFYPADSGLQKPINKTSEIQDLKTADSKVTIKVDRKMDNFESLEMRNSDRIQTEDWKLEEKSAGKEKADPTPQKESEKEFDREHNWNQDEDNDDRQRSSRHFRGHWSGFEIAFNNWMYEGSMTLPDDISYMSLDENNSIGFNLNFSQLSIGLSRHIGFVTGVGLTCNNYRFAERNSIIVGNDGIIAPVYFTGVTPPVKKSKFSDMYLNIPALLEIQIPAGFDKHLNVSAGFIGGLKLNACTKVVYYEDGDKLKVNGDYNLSLLRGGVTARIGYQNFMLFGTYYLTQWFLEQKGPGSYNLEPFEIGLAFTFNN